MKRLGKKGRAWVNARRKLKKVFLERGITTCEAKLEGCLGGDGLGFAHTLNKRRNLTDEDLSSPEKVVLLCNSCHWDAERKGESEMAVQLQSIIDARQVENL